MPRLSWHWRKKKTVNINNNNNRTNFLTKFDPRRPNFTKLIKENFYLLQSNAILKGLFPENRVPVANKRKNNLKELLQPVRQGITTPDNMFYSAFH